ncbi:hypothetical protein MLD38_018854 [Melastoma candidum]|uniref:Uncharacterized protein n=1 Tax=Melastoma candidum TaxID=119954 RepID=A0ACB9QYL1_9MYRT|nr:hypothetical protein MLD38_018854 [Melastoma candidum]
MGKSFPSTTTKLHHLANIISSSKPLSSSELNRKHPRTRLSIPPRGATASSPAFPAAVSIQSSGKERVKSTALPKDKMESNKGLEVESSTTTTTMEGNCRLPLARVVSDCVKRWFQETLKEAKAGDCNMQVLVGQMYNSGYGVPKDPNKGRAWINKASRARSSVWRLGDKRPGYNASDSDSEEDKAAPS